LLLNAASDLGVDDHPVAAVDRLAASDLHFEASFADGLR